MRSTTTRNDRVVLPPRVMRGNASFSRDGRYRYSLTRTWGSGSRIVWVLLNPSTADATRNDPTIRRCIGFSQRWGFGGLEAVNLLALRATRPEMLRQAKDPVGPRNDRALRRAIERADVLIAAWGNHGTWLGRSGTVRGWLTDETMALGVTARGEPVHPLYVRGDTLPVSLLQVDGIAR